MPNGGCGPGRERELRGSQRSARGVEVVLEGQARCAGRDGRGVATQRRDPRQLASLGDRRPRQGGGEAPERLDHTGLGQPGKRTRVVRRADPAAVYVAVERACDSSRRGSKHRGRAVECERARQSGGLVEGRAVMGARGVVARKLLHERRELAGVLGHPHREERVSPDARQRRSDRAERDWVSEQRLDVSVVVDAGLLELRLQR